MSDDEPIPSDPTAPFPEVPDREGSQERAPGDPARRLRIIQFPKAAPIHGQGIAGKVFSPANCVDPLQNALKMAQNGGVIALAVTMICRDGSEMFLVAANSTTFSEVLGSLEILKKAIIDATVQGFDIKPPEKE